VKRLDSEDVAMLALLIRRVGYKQEEENGAEFMEIRRLLVLGVSLENALGVCRTLEPSFNPLIALKALSYFGPESRVPIDVQAFLQSVAARVRAISTVPD
jgi:hypothetical protein